MKKKLYIDKYFINREMLEVEKLNGYVSKLHNLLLLFGVSDPGAIKDPINIVNKKLIESMPTKEFETPISNILKLINKESEYKALLGVSDRVMGHKYIDMLVFSKNYFSVSPVANLMLTDLLTPYTTDPKEIEFVERIEKFIDEAASLSEILGVNLGNTDVLRTFHAHRINGKTLIVPGDHIKRIKTF